MSTPTVIRSTVLNKNLHLVITYYENNKFLAAYQVYEQCSEYTVLKSSSVYTEEHGAITAFLMSTV